MTLRGDNPDSKGNRTKCTLFLRNLPLNCTAADLEGHFSQFGPIRSAFPVIRPGAETAIAFVHFAVSEDAIQALSSFTTDGKGSFMGREIFAEMALRKHAKKAANLIVKEPTKKRQPEKDNSQGLKPKLQDPTLTVFFKGNQPLTFTQKHLYKKFRKAGNLKKVLFPLPLEETSKEGSKNESRSAQFIFSNIVEVQKATPKIDGHIFKGVKMVVISSSLKSNPSSLAIKKKHRLIVRNLPFNIKESSLRQVFQEFGEISDISIPLQTETKQSKGFAFVQFAKHLSAQAAMEALNGKTISGRIVAVDYAVSKTFYEQNSPSVSESLKTIEKDDIPSVDAAKIEETVHHDETVAAKVPIDTVSMSDDDESVDDLDKTIFIRNIPLFLEEKDLASRLESHFGKLKYCKIVKNRETGEKRGTAFAQFFSKEAALAAIAESRAACQQSSPSESFKEENLSIATPVERALSKVQQKLEALARNRTGKSFSFQNHASYFSTIEGLVDANGVVKSGIVIDGYPLAIFPALDKKGIVKLRDQRQFLDSGPQDRRNLYLLQETILKPKTLVAQKFWPSIDFAYRETLFKERRRELRNNPNLFLSQTRLSLQQLPHSIDEKLIKKVLYAAVERALLISGAQDEGYPIIDDNLRTRAIHSGPPYLKQVKVVRDSIRNRSKGYGFAEFSIHEHALLAVRFLTNYEPRLWKEFGGDAVKATSDQGRHNSKLGTPFKSKAPIVEFATEKQAIVEKRIKRLKTSSKQCD